MRRPPVSRFSISWSFATTPARSARRRVSAWLGGGLSLILGWGVAGAVAAGSPEIGHLELVEVDSVSTSAYVVTATVYESGGKHYLFSGGGKSELDTFLIGADGQLTPLRSYTLWQGKQAGPARGLVTATIGGKDFLFVGNKFGNAIEVHRIHPGGVLERVFLEKDSELTHLGVVITLKVVAMKSASYLLAGGLDEKPGLSSFLIHEDGSLTHVQSTPDDDEIFTDGIIGMISHRIDGRTFVVAGGFQDSGVSSFEIHEDGRFTNVHNVGDDLSRFLNGTYPVDGVTLADQHFALVGHRHHRYYKRAGFIKNPNFVYHGNGVTVFKVDGAGALQIQSVLGDGPGVNIAGQTRIESLKLNEEQALVFIGTRDGQSIQLGLLDAQGSLRPVGFKQLDYGIYYAMAAVEIDGRSFVFAGSTDSPALHAYEVKFPTESR